MVKKKSGVVITVEEFMKMKSEDSPTQPAQKVFDCAFCHTEVKVAPTKIIRCPKCGATYKRHKTFVSSKTPSKGWQITFEAR